MTRRTAQPALQWIAVCLPEEAATRAPNHEGTLLHEITVPICRDTGAAAGV